MLNSSEPFGDSNELDMRYAASMLFGGVLTNRLYDLGKQLTLAFETLLLPSIPAGVETVGHYVVRQSSGNLIISSPKRY